MVVSPITVIASPADCSSQFDPIGRRVNTLSCDIAKSALARAGVSYQNEVAPANETARVRAGTGERAIFLTSFNGAGLSPGELKAQSNAFDSALAGKLKEAGYPGNADPGQIHFGMSILICAYLIFNSIMIYGPLAATLVELFPARIRYTSLSLPYHLGNGWFGGLLPASAFAIVIATGNIYSGLWYPVVVALAALLSCALLLRETHGAADRR